MTTIDIFVLIHQIGIFMKVRETFYESSVKISRKNIKFVSKTSCFMLESYVYNVKFKSFMPHYTVKIS